MLNLVISVRFDEARFPDSKRVDDVLYRFLTLDRDVQESNRLAATQKQSQITSRKCPL